MPDDIDIVFPPLWTPTATETAEIALKKAQAIRDTFQAGLFQADTATERAEKLQEETGMFGSISDEEINNNMGKTYRDLTALRDPLMGLEYNEPTNEEPRPFDGAAQDAAVTDYNPQSKRTF